MRLKEIKPGMVIHCKNEEEKKALLEEAERLGYVWYGSEQKPTEKLSSTGNTIHFYDASLLAEYKYITHSGQIGGDIIEFSDLIIPDMSAEEVLTIISKMCINKSCKECYLGEFCDHTNSACSLCSMDPSVIIDACVKWKSEHEKKEPEVEWFWQGRIFQIYEDGGYYQIKDGAGFYDTGCEYRESAEEYMADTLKEYCKSHEGSYIATVEHVCRVKEVK